MKKELVLTITNNTKINANVVLFDALKNATCVSNPLNTLQSGNNLSLPVATIDGLMLLLANQANAANGGSKKGLCYFDFSGALNMDATALINGVTTSLNSIVISLRNNAYFQFLECLKTQSIRLFTAHVESNISPLQDENWLIVRTLENGEQQNLKPSLMRAISPNTVNATIAILEVNKNIDKYTGIVVNVLPLEVKTYTFIYSII